MAFYANVGYTFPLPGNGTADGGIILASGMPMHQLVRRRLVRQGHLANLVFDPQLYLAGMDANTCKETCAKLSSYSWFGASLPDYDSSLQRQTQWRANAIQAIARHWRGVAPTAQREVAHAVAQCIDLQCRMNMNFIILPSPLTVDPGTAYDVEISWLEEGLRYAREVSQKPVYATVAIADGCLRYTDPERNSMLELVADSVSAREVDGVYLVIEQGGESSDVRQCSNYRTLASILHLVHLFGVESRLQVAVNFIGTFGLACQAAGAQMWGSGWYKSVYRLRLADSIAGGRAYPSYWSHPAACDIHLDDEFDTLSRNGFLNAIEDATTASAGLFRAARKGTSVASVPAWRYAPSNVTTCREHFYLSSMAAESRFARVPTAARMQYVEDWLTQAAALAQQMSRRLGNPPPMKTKLAHVRGWLDAVLHHRRVHNV